MEKKMEKEYTEYGQLKFEGEYLNGKKNGKGKEYYYFYFIKFKGENLIGKILDEKGISTNHEIKHGKGLIKEYNYRGELKFEAENLNGERNGKGKKIDYNGEIEFEG